MRTHAIASAELNLRMRCTKSEPPRLKGPRRSDCLRREDLVRAGARPLQRAVPLRVPVAKRSRELTLEGCRQWLGVCDPAGDLQRLPQLFQVGAASVAAGDMVLEAREVGGRKRALEVVGHP